MISHLHISWLGSFSLKQRCQLLVGGWRSPRIITALKTTEIISPEENGCFREWTLWHYILLKSLPSQNLALPRLLTYKYMSWKSNISFLFEERPQEEASREVEGCTNKLFTASHSPISYFPVSRMISRQWSLKCVETCVWKPGLVEWLGKTEHRI